MKWIAAAVLAGCLIIAAAVVAARPAPPPDPFANSAAPRFECELNDGFWIEADERCYLP